MADRATDIITLAQARAQLRQVGADPEFDALITATIEAAVRYVDEQTRIGVLKRAWEWMIDLSDRDRAIEIATRHNAELSDGVYEYPNMNRQRGDTLQPLDGGAAVNICLLYTSPSPRDS